MSSLFASSDEIVKIWQSLRACWDETRQSWKDSDRDQFEREFIAEFSQVTNTYIASLRRMSETVQGIEKEVP